MNTMYIPLKRSFQHEPETVHALLSLGSMTGPSITVLLIDVLLASG
jgi:hypothetical protein